MSEYKPHETPPKSKRIVKYILFGISALTILSSISMPWSSLLFKEIIIALIGLLFINAFLVWSYYIIVVWRQRMMEYLEQKYNVKIVGMAGGSFKVEGDVNFVTKAFINTQILLYFFLGMIGPLFLFVGFLILLG